jgi:hypothetical protein
VCCYDVSSPLPSITRAHRPDTETEYTVNIIGIIRDFGLESLAPEPSKQMVSMTPGIYVSKVPTGCVIEGSLLENFPVMPILRTHSLTAIISTFLCSAIS